MRTSILAFGLALLAAGCLDQRPGFDSGIEQCGDASAGPVCLRGVAGACDVRHRVVERCHRRPPCGCSCPLGYIRESECTTRTP